jgi:VWFA-related protein
MKRVWMIVVLTAIVGAGRTDAQAPTSRAVGPAFRGGVDVVALNVTVTDASRRFVTDLERNNFLVFEDGKPQQVTFFQQTGLSLAIALLLDTSASMDDKLAVVHEAAIGFARQLGQTDVASVIDFNTRVSVRQEFTNDVAALERAIRRTTAGGSTALYNALYFALRGLSKVTPDERTGEPRRRAIIVLTDGEDTSSLIGFDEVLDFAARSDTAIYAIGLIARSLPDTRSSQGAQFVLRRFADQTGGRAYFPADVKDLQGVYAEIKAELSSQYSLAYESSNSRRDGQFRRVAVRVDRTGAQARTRPGYYAPTK